MNYGTVPTVMLTALAVAIVACGDSDSASAGPIHTVIDSAGVSIVRNGSPEGVPLHDLRGRQVLDLGAVDGPPEYLFSRVSGIALLDDGGIAVSDRSNRIRYYEADGSFVKSFGREGEGPGEFAAIHGLWQRDDGALVALDGRQWRITVIGETGRLDTYPVMPPGINLMRSGFLEAEEGDFVVTSELVLSVPERGFVSSPIVVRRAPLAPGPADTLLMAEGPRYGPVRTSDGIQMIATPLFEPDYFTGVSGDAIVVTDCATPEFRERLAPDSVSRIVRWDAGNLAVTDADLEAYRQSRLAGVEEPAARERIVDAIDGLPVNERIPACSDLEGTKTGQVWVKAYERRPGAPNDWHVFDDGRLIGTVRLPVESRLRAIGPDRVATVERDDLEVEHVRVYPLPEMSP